MAERIMQPSGSANNNFQPNISPQRPSPTDKPVIGNQGTIPPIGNKGMGSMGNMGRPSMNGNSGAGRPPMGGRPPVGGGMGRPPMGGRPPVGGGMGRPPMNGKPPMNSRPSTGGGIPQGFNPQTGMSPMGTNTSKPKVSNETKWAFLLLFLIVLWFKMIFSAPIIIHNNTTPKEQLEKERIEKKQKIEESRKYKDSSNENTNTKIPTESKVY